MSISNFPLINEEELKDFPAGIVLIENEILKIYKKEPDGLEALKYLSFCVMYSRFPNLIFVDEDMPNMNGFDFITHFEKIFYKDFPETKIIFISSHDCEISAKKIANFKSVSGSFQKPLTKEVLIRIIS
jgi:two-component SAPR family response regulator